MIEQLKTIFEESAKAGTGRLCVGFKDLVTGEEVYYNGDTVFPTASVYKTFVLCELFRREKEGTFSFSDTHTLLESDKRIVSGILELIGEGAVLSMMDYTMLMMVISDNTSSSRPVCSPMATMPVTQPGKASDSFIASDSVLPPSIFAPNPVSSGRIFFDSSSASRNTPSAVPIPA